MPLIKRFVVSLLVTASAFAQAQSFATIDVKPAGLVDPQSKRGKRSVVSDNLVFSELGPESLGALTYR